MHKLFGYDKVRFAIVGCLNTSLDFTFLNFYTSVLHLPILVANTLAVSACIFISYFFNHYWVFKRSHKTSWNDLGLFICVTGFSSIVLQNLVIWCFHNFTHSVFGRSLWIIQQLNNHSIIELNLSKAIAVGVGMVWNFILYKYAIFKPESGFVKDTVLSLD